LKFIENLKAWYAETSGLVDTLYDAKLKEFQDKKHAARQKRHEKWKRDNGKNEHERIA
jgi:hypothetical protein